MGKDIMSIFSSLRQYATNWVVSNVRPFTTEEINSVDHAEVVASSYGNSVCFYMASGVQTFIPLDRDSQLTVGQTVSLQNAQLVTLSKPGEGDIYRVRA